MKLPKTLTTVTPFSKIIALCLFAILPIGFFLIGMKYQAKIDMANQPVPPINPQISTIPTPTTGTLNWKTYGTPTQSFSLKVSGTAILGPTCPVERPGQSCTKPYQGIVAVKSADGSKTITQFTAGIDGSFSVTLSPGTYLFVPQNGVTKFANGRPATITISTDKMTGITIPFDTGIR